MTSWPVPKPLFAKALTDAVSGPTPLGALKEELKKGDTVQQIMDHGISYIHNGQQVVYHIPSYMNAFMGDVGGSLGEISAVALLIGAAYMLWKKVITWEVPTAYLGSVIIFAGILWLVDPLHYVNPLFHLLTGGLLLGAFYMATDMVSSPMTSKGMIVYGIGCGVITMVIRLWGGYPEGVSFAILIMNAVVPLINQGFKPVRFGKIKNN